MIKLLLVSMMLAGCVDNTYREFNHDDKQDPSCYGTSGGRPGYCDARIRGHI
jgi:hypothetical protein